MSDKRAITLLLIEDSLGDARLLREMLDEQTSTKVQLVHVERMSEAEKYLSEHAVDIILLDLGLPDANGLSVVQRARTAAPGVTLVVLTGLDDESMATQALHEGAQDYLIKGQLETRGLMRALHYAVERNDLEEALLLEGARLATANRVLDRKNEDLEAFTYSVSHDLKEPLRAIEGFSQHLITNYADQLDAQGQELLGRVVKASLRMKFLIDDLLALCRAGAEVALANEVTNTRSVVDAIVRSIGPQIKDRSATIKIGPLSAVAADRARVEQIFRNLISNALKYNRRPHPTIEIGVLRREGSSVTFYVKDNGIGIDPQYHGQIFGLFQRLHTRDEFEGNGAGLAIVKRAVEALAGEVWLESTEGRGTTFFVSLPAAVASKMKAEEKIAA